MRPPGRFRGGGGGNLSPLVTRLSQIEGKRGPPGFSGLSGHLIERRSIGIDRVGREKRSGVTAGRSDTV